MVLTCKEIKARCVREARHHNRVAVYIKRRAVSRYAASAYDVPMYQAHMRQVWEHKKRRDGFMLAARRYSEMGV